MRHDRTEICIKASDSANLGQAQRIAVNQANKEGIQKAVRDHYAQASGGSECDCGCAPNVECCGSRKSVTVKDISLALGYSPQDLLAAPAESNLGLGCGNPAGIASLRRGEIVVDLGSGGGLDCFLAARAVGEEGHVIGVDMTPEMVAEARRNAGTAGFANVEFRLGEIENLPVADGLADVVISNCVINLSPEKHRVFHETFRVLKPGGRLVVSDMVRIGDFPEGVERDMAMYTSCIAGATTVPDIEYMLKAAGFQSIRITTSQDSKTSLREWVPGSSIEEYIASATIEAEKSKAQATTETLGETDERPET